MFLTELAGILCVSLPDPAQETNREKAQDFELSVALKQPDGSETTGFFDLSMLYAFGLKAKQRGKRTSKPDATHLALPPEDAGQIKAGSAARGTRRWDTALLAAR